LFRRSVPTPKFTSQLGSAARAITDIIHMGTTIRTAILTTDRTGIMAIIGLIMGTVGTAITTATIVTIIIGK
jgi:hypothetical protein